MRDRNGYRIAVRLAGGVERQGVENNDASRPQHRGQVCGEVHADSSHYGRRVIGIS
ncbi:hypothetical protein V1Y59_19870 [Gordonia sp. PKS22-38]|uniref:Uncharacterized protein n=1 Tax=Gordonia prachuapensis TaxID=3115651 RepID=A0ABU7MYC9_9ACTN|nr:hypothetical protein [Gordonia sp. PKS22-38]